LTLDERCGSHGLKQPFQDLNRLIKCTCLVLNNNGFLRGPPPKTITREENSKFANNSTLDEQFCKNIGQKEVF